MIHILLVTLLFLLMGTLGLKIALLTAQYFSKKPISLRALFNGLKPKLWMTAGVGFFFFGLYGLIVVLTSYLMSMETRQYLFSYALQYPIYFIYAGLTLFVSISISILWVRSVIKRVYNSRK